MIRSSRRGGIQCQLTTLARGHAPSANTNNNADKDAARYRDAAAEARAMKSARVSFISFPFSSHHEERRLCSIGLTRNISLFLVH